MNKRLRILVLCVCGSVGVAIALAVAWRPKAPRAADPNMAVLPSGDFSTHVATTPVASTPVAAVPVESPTPAKVETSAPPASPAPAPAPTLLSSTAESAENKNFQRRVEQTLDDIRDENKRQQRRVEDDMVALQEKIQRTPPPLPRSERATDADPTTDDLPPPPGTPNPIKSEGDGQLSFDWPDNTDIRQALKLLNEQGLNILVSKNVTGTVSASLTKVDAESDSGDDRPRTKPTNGRS